MEVWGHCLKCGEYFNAHWHYWKEKDGCPRCHNKDPKTLITRNDESDDYKRYKYEDKHGGWQNDDED